jgi:hypothetical protein
MNIIFSEMYFLSFNIIYLFIYYFGVLNYFIMNIYIYKLGESSNTQFWKVIFVKTFLINEGLREEKISVSPIPIKFMAKGFTEDKNQCFVGTWKIWVPTQVRF